ncbi:hypothetical protein M0Q50_09510 [bacterium]|jgi:hypothetical protein|nr:hypothetical protein [bacterium]
MKTFEQFNTEEYDNIDDELLSMCQSGRNVKRIRELIDLGANFNIEDEDENDCLFNCILNNNIRCVHDLLIAGAIVTSKHIRKSLSMNCNIKILINLLEYLDKPLDNDYFTYSDFSNINLYKLKLLIEYGLDLEYKYNDQKIIEIILPSLKYEKYMINMRKNAIYEIIDIILEKYPEYIIYLRKVLNKDLEEKYEDLLLSNDIGLM